MDSKRSMGLFALLMFSVGSIIGTGIFVILGRPFPKPVRRSSSRSSWRPWCVRSQHCRTPNSPGRSGLRIFLLLRLRHSAKSSRGSADGA